MSGADVELERLTEAYAQSSTRSALLALDAALVARGTPPAVSEAYFNTLEASRESARKSELEAARRDGWSDALKQLQSLGPQINASEGSSVVYQSGGQGSTMTQSNATGFQTTWEKPAVFISALAFIVVILALALFVPNPTAFQYTVFRIVLALAAGGFGASISGFIRVTFRRWLQAGGGLAVFAIVYFLAPVGLTAVGVQPVTAAPKVGSP